MSGERGPAILKLRLPTNWIVREQPTSDYGIDVEVELASDTVSGILCKGQVKSKTPIAWRQDGTFREVVGKKKLVYWQILALPVVVFLVDNTTEEVFWAPVTSSAPAELVITDSVTIERRMNLPQTTDALERHIRGYVHYATAKRSLYRLPGTLERWQRRLESTDRDFFLPVDEEFYRETHEFFDELLTLREAVGLSNADILPWIIWTERSRLFFPDGGGLLYWGIYDELVTYLKPFIEETVERAKTLLEREDPTPANAAAKALVDKEKRGYAVSYRFDFGLQDSLDWNKIERILDEKGALFMRMKKKQPV
jgi:hypothetical protein